MVTDSTDASEGETRSWGALLPVESVQEIVRKDPSIVPERYVRTMNDTMLPHLSSEIPTVDLSVLCYGDKDELEKLDMACQEWSFFQIINHGIPSEVLKNAKSVASEFFKLPLEQKKCTRCHRTTFKDTGKFMSFPNIRN